MTSATAVAAAGSPPESGNDETGSQPLTPSPSLVPRTASPRVLSPYIVPVTQCSSQLFSPLLAAAAASVAAQTKVTLVQPQLQQHPQPTGRCPGAPLSQSNVPASESEKLTGTNPHVDREVNEPRPQANDIESTVCPSSIEPFRKAWWAGIRPATCERTCRHRSKVCDAIQLCNDCTGYYCKWLADLVGIPVLKASGRVDRLVFEQDPLARLYWERISKVACCPKMTTKCLMCIRRYQLFTHFLPGNLVFRSLVHESVMKLHEEGFAVDMGLIRKVTRRHLERIADSMRLVLPPEYLSSLHAYDIVVRRGPLMDVFTNGLNSAAAAVGVSGATTRHSLPSSSSSELSPRGKAGGPFASIRHMPVIVSPTCPPAKAGTNTTTVAFPGVESETLTITEDDKEPADHSDNWESRLSSGCSSSVVVATGGVKQERSSSSCDPRSPSSLALSNLIASAAANNSHLSPLRSQTLSVRGEDLDEDGGVNNRETVLKTDPDSQTDQVSQYTSKPEVANAGALAPVSCHKRRSRRQVQRPRTLGDLYYGGDEADLLSILDEDEGGGRNHLAVAENECCVESDGGTTQAAVIRSKRKRRKTARQHTGRRSPPEYSDHLHNYQDSLFEQDSTMALDSLLAKQFCGLDGPAATGCAGGSNHSAVYSVIGSSTAARFSNTAPRGGYRPIMLWGPEATSGPLCGGRVTSPDNIARADTTATAALTTLDEKRDDWVDSKGGLFEGSPADLWHRVAHELLRGLEPSGARLNMGEFISPATTADLSTTVNEQGHRHQLREEIRLQDAGVHGVFWDPSKEGWCTVVPLLPTMDGNVIRHKRQILCFTLQQLRSYESAKWSAVYERLRRNPIELERLSRDVRQDLSDWVRDHIEPKAFPPPISSTGPTTTHRRTLSSFESEPKSEDALENESHSADHSRASASRLADLLGSLARHIVTLGRSDSNAAASTAASSQQLSECNQMGCHSISRAAAEEESNPGLVGLLASFQSKWIDQTSDSGGTTGADGSNRIRQAPRRSAEP